MKDNIYDEIINNDLFKREINYIQHSNITTYAHSIFVTNTCLKIADKLKLKVDRNSLIKGSLLHDYYLYDWHIRKDSKRFHGFVHPKYSKINAERDFGLNKKETNMILSHMFPMGFKLPRYKESIILCLADKYCASYEVLFPRKFLKKKKGIMNENKK